MNYSIKTTRLVVAGLFFIILATSMLQAQQSTAEQLVGTWLFDDTTSFSSIDQETSARMDTIPALQAQLITSYRGRKTFFGGDGTYRVTLADGRSVTGSWNLTSSGEIKLTDPSGNTSYQKIAGLQGDRLILIPMVSGDFKSILTQWHFVKL